MRSTPSGTRSEAAEFFCEPFRDERGAFINALNFQQDVFEQHWGKRPIRQINLSSNINKGTLRGLHFQRDQFSEAKIVRCLKGRIFDVTVDLRADSQGYLEVRQFILDAVEGNSVFIPEGHAHGFQTLEDHCEVLYLHSKDRDIEAETGIRWDDPDLAISWPLEPTVMSARDSNLPCLASL